VLRAYRRLDIEALAALRLSAGTEAEVEAAMRRYMRHVLEREARSLAFLDEVRAGH
jgi:DNA repair protein RecO (recombination protein O)